MTQEGFRQDLKEGLTEIHAILRQSSLTKKAIRRIYPDATRQQLIEHMQQEMQQQLGQDEIVRRIFPGQADIILSKGKQRKPEQIDYAPGGDALWETPVQHLHDTIIITNLYSDYMEREFRLSSNRKLIHFERRPMDVPAGMASEYYMQTALYRMVDFALRPITMILKTIRKRALKKPLQDFELREAIYFMQRQDPDTEYVGKHGDLRLQLRERKTPRLTDDHPKL